MAKIFFAPVHVAGHFFPTIPLAKSLQARGHEISYVSECNMREVVEGEGIRYFQVGPGVWAGNIAEKFPKIKRLKGNPRIHYILKDAYLGLTPQYVRDAIPIIEEAKPDLLVFDPLSFPGPILAELTRTPWVTTSMFLGMIPGNGSPPYSLGWPPAQNLCQRLFYKSVWIALIAYCRRYDKVINRIRKEFGLPAKRMAFLNSSLSPYLYLSFTSSDIEYPIHHLPPQVHLVGPSVWSSPQNYDPPEWLHTFPQRRPAVYFTIGTVESAYDRRFFSIAAEAVRAAPEIEAVMTVCYDGSDIGDLAIPKNLRIERYVPNALIVPKVDLVVHHGGFSTTLDCLMNGTPSVVIPFEGDQNENGRRLSYLRAGYRMRYKELTPEKLKETIFRALQDRSLSTRSKEIAGSLERHNGPEAAADLVERLIHTGKPVLRTEVN
jgi:MGT family glycosyltransferase